MIRITALAALLFGLLGLAAVAPSAHAADAVLICHVGGPGSTKQAASAIGKFLRQMERAAGLDAGALEGEYHTSWKACSAYIDAQKPAIGVFDLATHLKHRTKLNLKPFAHVGAGDSQTYHLLVREGSFATVADLGGQEVASLTRDRRFVTKILMGGKAPTPTITLKRVSRPLKALRRVAREKSAAAMVDAETFAHIKTLDLGVTLVSLHTSEGLPGLTMSAMGGRGAGLAAKLSAALDSLCKGDGASLCKTFGVRSFARVDAARMKALGGRY